MACAVEKFAYKMHCNVLPGHARARAIIRTHFMHLIALAHRKVRINKQTIFPCYSKLFYIQNLILLNRYCIQKWYMCLKKCMNRDFCRKQKTHQNHMQIILSSTELFFKKTLKPVCKKNTNKKTNLCIPQILLSTCNVFSTNFKQYIV